MKYQTKESLYVDVWRAMDACNASGLIHSFPDMVQAIGEFEGLRGAMVNNHPIVILMADKLLQLSGIYSQSNDQALIDAYSVVGKIARDSAEVQK